MKRPVIQISYCGGCNPDIDRVQLVKTIVARLSEEITFMQSPEADLELLMNGCAHACIDEERTGSTSERCVVSVQGNRVDYRSFHPDDLASAVIERIRERLGQLSKQV